MRVISPEERELFDQLAQLAGGPLLVEVVLRELSSRYGRAPRLEEVVDEIVRQRKSADPQPGAVAAGGSR